MILTTEGGEMDQSMSMSQKLTLGYAVLVGSGGGGVDYINSGSKKSLLAGTIPSAVLLNAYTDLPARPVLASSMGLGISLVLLVAMGLRFNRSRKLFPAGVISLVSLVMAEIYLHGLIRSLH